MLEQYNMEISSTRKIRGAVLCDTNRGWFLLKEVSLTANRIPALCELYEYLRTEGYTHLDHIEMNREGGHITEMENGEKDILKHWCDGKECEIRRSEELVEASAELAKLHLLLQHLSLIHIYWTESTVILRIRSIPERESVSRILFLASMKKH